MLSEEMLKLVEEASQREDIQKEIVQIMMSGSYDPWRDSNPIEKYGSWVPPEISERSMELMYNFSACSELEQAEGECYGDLALLPCEEAMQLLVNKVNQIVYKKLFNRDAPIYF